MTSLVNLITNKHIAIILGPGGVGKTSCSIAIAIYAAYQGLKVGLLSIDPARRLRDALGLPIGNELKTIKIAAGCTIDAAMLDQKAVFDDMVLRYARNHDQAQTILQHRLYRSASSRLAGALEYMALAKVQQMVDCGLYDLIVLDTPPDTHAMDFLARPNILAGFKDNLVMSWLIKPFNLVSKLGLSKLITVSERLMGGIAKVTGIQALSILSEFLVLMQDVIEGFHTSGNKIINTLNSSQTAFIGVMAPQSSALTTINSIEQDLNKMGFNLDLILLNRMLPKNIATIINSSSTNKNSILQLLAQRILFEDTLYQNLNNNAYKVVRIAEQVGDMHTPQAMQRFAHNLGVKW